MALSKKDEEKIKQAVYQSVNLIAKELRDVPKDKYKHTEKRLYAYPVLKRNIKRYKLDIEDIRHEDIRKSKDIVLYTTAGGGTQPDIEELRAAKILLIEQKIARDEKEIVEIDIALQEIKNDEYFNIIPMKYIEKISNEEIAQELHCDMRTIGRHKSRLIKEISLGLYGADAL